MKLFRRIVGEEHSFQDEDSLLGFSSDYSELLVKPELVVQPVSVEEVRRIVLRANQQKRPLSIRGSGSGFRGGALGRGVVISTKRFSRILRLSTSEGFVDVQAGVSLKDLNRLLREYSLELPVMSYSEEATIGGLLGVNAPLTRTVTLNNHGEEDPERLLRIKDLVIKLSFVDGTGKFFELTKKEDFDKVVGLEGMTGIIISARLRVVPTIIESAELIPANDFSEAITKLGEFFSQENKSRRLSRLSRIAYLNKRGSASAGLPEKDHIVIFFEGKGGSYEEGPLINKLLRIINNPLSLIANELSSMINNRSVRITPFSKKILDLDSSFNNFVESLPFFDDQGPIISVINNGFKEGFEKGVFRGGFLLTGFSALPLTDAKSMVSSTKVSFRGLTGFGIIKNPLRSKELITKTSRLKESYDYNNLLGRMMTGADPIEERFITNAFTNELLVSEEFSEAFSTKNNLSLVNDRERMVFDNAFDLLKGFLIKGPFQYSKINSPLMNLFGNEKYSLKGLLRTIGYSRIPDSLSAFPITDSLLFNDLLSTLRELSVISGRRSPAGEQLLSLIEENKENKMS